MNKLNENVTVENTEERILKAAEREFLDKGFAGARTTSIAEAAGVTHAMLHYYFRTKEKLFQKILSDKIMHLRDMMLITLLDTDLPIMEKISSAIETHLDFLYRNPDLPRFMLNVISSNREIGDFFKIKLKEDKHDIIAIFQEEIDRSASQGLCKRVDARTLLLDIISLNAFSFVGMPLISNVLGQFPLDEQFIAERKRNNVEMIMQKLKP